jgi:hypothetical protein
LGAALAAALWLAGCGSGSEQRAVPPPQPRLPQPVAATLASSSDEVAQALSAGDPCGALTLAQQLQQQTVTAINAGRVPSAFQEPLGSTVADLVSRIHCVPAPNKHDNGKHEGEKKKNKHEGND